MADEEKKFYPTNSGWTKSGVIEYITDHLGEGGNWEGVGEPDITKLTDEMMQKLADEWHEQTEAVIAGEEYADDALENQDQMMCNIAKMIAKD